MQTHDEKSKAYVPPSVENTSKNQSSVKEGKISDNRPETVTQRKFSELANSMPVNSQSEPVQLIGEDDDNWVNGNQFGDNPLNFREYRNRRAQLDRQRFLEAVESFEFRFYHKTYRGRNALIAAIINKHYNPYRADYSVDLINRSIQKMEGVELNTGQTIDGLINSPGDPFAAAAIRAYDESIRDTDGRTDTQLGLMADNVTYK